MKNKFFLYIFIFLITITALYLIFIFRPQKIKDHNYSKEIVKNQSEKNLGQISSLSTKKESKITINSNDIIIGSGLVSVLMFFIFYYSIILYLKSKYS